MHIKRFCILLITMIIYVNTIGVYADEKQEITFYVDAKSENISGDGSINKPFSNIESAMKAIRQLKIDEQLNKPVNVIFREGEYSILNTVKFLQSDSGTKENPITYKSYPNERVVFTGEKKIDITKAKPVGDKIVIQRLPKDVADKIVCIDLAQQGLTGFGYTEEMGFQDHAPKQTTLIQDEKLLTRARYPNEGYMDIKKVLYGGNGTKETGTIFSLDNLSPRAEMWKNSKHDALLTGFFRYNWKSDSVRIRGVEDGYMFTQGSEFGGVSSGYMAFIENVLEEIDAPGEWYIDSKTDVLYYYPLNPLDDKTELKLNCLKNEMFNFDSTEFVSFKNIIFECGQYTAFELNKTKDMGFFGCTIRNFGDSAFNLVNTFRVGIQSCDIYNLGGRGIGIYTDLYSELIPSENYIRNCDIHDFGLVNKILSAALKLNGVGVYFGHNRVYNAPHGAVMMPGPLPGNNNIFEYNECFNLLTETSDSGVFYIGRGILAHGNIFRYNYIHDIYQYRKDMAGYAAAFYLDDVVSGVTIYGNVMNRVQMGVQIGGGKDILCENNIIMNANDISVLSIECESRDSTNWRNNLEPTLRDTLSMVDIYNEQWRKSYPQVQRYVNEDLMMPVNQITKNNVIYKHKPIVVSENVKKYGLVTDNFITDEEVGFLDEKNENLVLKENSVIYDALPNFKPIPFQKIGLYKDDYRTSVEPKEANVR